MVDFFNLEYLLVKNNFFLNLDQIGQEAILCGLSSWSKLYPSLRTRGKIGLEIRQRRVV